MEEEPESRLLGASAPRERHLLRRPEPAADWKALWLLPEEGLWEGPLLPAGLLRGRGLCQHGMCSLGLLWGSNQTHFCLLLWGWVFSRPRGKVGAEQRCSHRKTGWQSPCGLLAFGITSIPDLSTGDSEPGQTRSICWVRPSDLVFCAKCAALAQNWGRAPSATTGAQGAWLNGGRRGWRAWEKPPEVLEGLSPWGPPRPPPHVGSLRPAPLTPRTSSLQADVFRDNIPYTPLTPKTSSLQAEVSRDSVTYAALSLDTSDEQPTYSNMEHLNNPPPSRILEKSTVYSTIRKP